MDIATLRAFCLSFPGAKEDVKWGNDLTFMVGEKVFCFTGFKNPPGVSIKVPEEEFAELTATPGITPAPYLARYKWVAIENVNTIPRKELERLLRQSYELVKAKLPKGVLKRHGLA